MSAQGLKDSYNTESASGFLRCALGVELWLLDFHSKRFSLLSHLGILVL